MSCGALWRFEIINTLIKKYGYKRYLEIGVEGGDCIRAVKCELMHGVDPASENATHKTTSDDFFANLPSGTTYDMIFIDGMHENEQVYRDLDNSLKVLSPNGSILMHDCNPPTKWHQRSYEEAQKNGCRLWNGTTWMAYVRFRMERSDLEMRVVDTDWGCGLVRRGVQKPLAITEAEITYDNMAKNRAEWLSLMSPSEFRAMYGCVSGDGVSGDGVSGDGETGVMGSMEGF